MIENKEIGLKITESPEETMWLTQKKALENEIENLEKMLKVNKVFLDASNKKLEECQKKN